MRKLFHKSVVILAIFMCCSLLLGIACKLDWNVAKASTGNPGGYINLTYQNLDDITYRSSVSSSPAQITVFTHGLGGTPSHWSNQGSEKEYGEYEYEYDATSMPEQLREKMEENGQSVIMFTAKMEIEPLLIERNLTEEEIEAQGLDKDKKYYNTSLSEEEWKSEQVSDDITNEKAGPESHQALYEKYFANTTTGDAKCTQRVELREQTKEGYVLTTDNQNIKHTLTANDTSKHIILIFEAMDKDGSNDYVYAQLEYIG